MSTSTPSACAACGGGSFAEPFVIPEQMFGTGEPFTYAACTACATVMITEVPDDLGRYYDTEVYYSFDEDPEATMGRPGVSQLVGLIGRATLFGPDRAVSRLAALSPIRQVRTLVSMFAAVRLAGLPRGRATRVLDVGAGAGALVTALDLAGMTDVTGIDPFAAGDKRIGRRARLLRRDLTDVEGPFDLVMMHHSFEHVPVPLTTLEQIRSRLAPDGRVLLRLPTVSSEAYDRYGVSWIGCDAPRHLVLFSRAGVDRIAARAGFEVVSVVDDSNESQFWASEQFRAGIPLAAPTSHFVDPRKSMFSRAEIRAWRRESAALNANGRGDQAAWVLRPAARPADLDMEESSE